MLLPPVPAPAARRIRRIFSATRARNRSKPHSTGTSKPAKQPRIGGRLACRGEQICPDVFLCPFLRLLLLLLGKEKASLACFHRRLVVPVLTRLLQNRIVSFACNELSNLNPPVFLYRTHHPVRWGCLCSMQRLLVGFHLFFAKKKPHCLKSAPAALIVVRRSVQKCLLLLPSQI